VVPTHATRGRVEGTVVIRARFSCVTENDASWFVKVQNLVLSIREHGGSLSAAPISVCFVDGVEPTYERWLAGFDVEVRVVEPVDSVVRYANKLRMLEVSDQDPFDVLVALDCDVVVLGDIQEFLNKELVQAKPADVDVLSDREWRRLFRRVGLATPKRSVITTTFGQRTYPYFNSGVLLIPRTQCERLSQLWFRFLQELEPVYETDPVLALRRRYHDQMSLTCCLVAADVPVRPLPLKMNVPTHVNIHPDFVEELQDPRIVHYHADLDERGFLVSSKYRVLNGRFDRFNRRRAELLGIVYSGLPRRSMRARLNQELASRRWFHSIEVQRLKRRTREALVRAGLWAPTGQPRKRSA
jgi:hypothetical protein